MCKYKAKIQLWWKKNKNKKTTSPAHQAMKIGYSFPHIDAWGPLFMTRDWGQSSITDSKGQRFLSNQHKDCGTMLKQQTPVIR